MERMSTSHLSMVPSHTTVSGCCPQTGHWKVASKLMLSNRAKAFHALLSIANLTLAVLLESGVNVGKLTDRQAMGFVLLPLTVGIQAETHSRKDSCCEVK